MLNFPLNYYMGGIDMYDPEGPFLYFKLEEMQSTVIILCGIPTSGKSTWAKNFQRMQYCAGDDFRSFRIISRDLIRELDFPQPYVINKQNEKRVGEIADKMIADCMRAKKPMIIDNTHCKEQYLKEALKQFEGTDYSVKIKFFDLPLWKAYYRNIMRNWRTGKWIPMNVIKAMKQNYDKIDRKKYERYNF